MAQHDHDLVEVESIGNVTLTLEDDTELECMILTTFSADDNQYIALLPLDEEGQPDEEAEVLLYRYVDHGDDADPELFNIETDEEYEKAADAFDELLDEAEFEEGEEE